MKTLLLLFVSALAWGQTKESRVEMLNGTSLPGVCKVSERFFKTDEPAGENLYLATNDSPCTWTKIVGSGGSATLPTPSISGGGTSTITVGANCTTAAPCNHAFGEQVYPQTAALTCQITAGTSTDTVYVYVTSAGALACGSTNRTITCGGVGGCLVPTGVTAFPSGGTSIPLFAVTASGTTYDAITGAMDKRALLSTGVRHIDGTGINSTPGVGEVTHAISSIVARRDVANSFTDKQTLTGNGASAAALNLASQTAPSSPADGDAWYASNQFNFRENGITKQLGSGSGGTTPSRSTMRITDEFFSGGSTSGTIGSIGWYFNNDSSAGTVAGVVSTAGHPGQFRLNTTASTNARSRIFAAATYYGDLTSSSWEATFVFKLATAVTAVRAVVGMVTEYDLCGVGSSRDCVAMVYDSTVDSTWKIRSYHDTTNQTGSPCDTSITPGTSDWITLRLTGAGTSTITAGWRVNGGSESTCTVTLNTTNNSNFAPVFGMLTTDASAKAMDIDWFDFVQSSGLTGR